MKNGNGDEITDAEINSMLLPEERMPVVWPNALGTINIFSGNNGGGSVNIVAGSGDGGSATVIDISPASMQRVELGIMEIPPAVRRDALDQWSRLAERRSILEDEIDVIKAEQAQYVGAILDLLIAENSTSAKAVAGTVYTRTEQRPMYVGGVYRRPEAIAALRKMDDSRWRSVVSETVDMEALGVLMREYFLAHNWTLPKEFSGVLELFFESSLRLRRPNAPKAKS